MRNKWLICVLILALMSVFATLESDAFVLFSADTIVYNGKIFTSDPSADPAYPETAFVSALAIRNGLIQVAGTDAEALAKQGPGTEVTNLNGKTVIPGWNDAHCHTLPYIYHGMFINDPYAFIPGPGPSTMEMLGLIQYLNPLIPIDQWFYGIVGDLFVEEGGLDRFILDTVAPDRPVIVYTWGGHYAVINTAMMVAAGISETESDPFGGYYERVPGSNVITGVLRECVSYISLRS